MKEARERRAMRGEFGEGGGIGVCRDLVGLPFVDELGRVFEAAKKGERVLLVSYGSGSGSDAFLLTMLRDGSPLPIDDRTPQELTYDQYLEHCHILTA